jgi:hypothetical protein
MSLELNLSIASVVVSGAALIPAIVSALVANNARRDAQRIADKASDEWAQQKWFDLYFKANAAYDAMDGLRDQFKFDRGKILRTYPITGLNYPECADDVIRLFREAQAMAMVFPKSEVIDNLCNATSGFVDDPREMLSELRLQNLMDAMNGIREKALVDSGVLERIVK